MLFCDGIQVYDPVSGAPAAMVERHCGPFAVSLYRSMRTGACVALLYVVQRIVCGFSRSQSVYRSGKRSAMCVAVDCSASAAVLPYAPWSGAMMFDRTNRKA